MRIMNRGDFGPGPGDPRSSSHGGHSSGVSTAAETRAADLARLSIPREPESRSPDRGPTITILRTIAVLALLGGVAAVAREKGLMAPVPEVEIASVVREGDSRFSGRLTASGYVVSRTKATLGFKIAGRIREIAAREGTRVKKGDIIARLEDRDLVAQLERAKAILATSSAVLAEMEAGTRRQEVERSHQAVLEAQASHAQTQRTLRRYEELLTKGAISHEQVDQARMSRDVAKARLVSAEQANRLLREGTRIEQILAQKARLAEARANVRVAEETLAETILVAPFEGLIIERQSEVGETLAFVADARQSSGAQVVTLADVDNLEVEVDISENNLAQIQEGRPTEIVVDAYPERKYQGTVRMIMPRANRQKAIVPVKVTIRASDRTLRPDMSAKVTFLPSSDAIPRQNAPVLVPLRAVWRHAGSDAVYVVQDGLARTRRVTVGGKRDDMVEVTDGLSGGESVVVSGVGSINDGVRVRVKG